LKFEFDFNLTALCYGPKAALLRLCYSLCAFSGRFRRVATEQRAFDMPLLQSGDTRPDISHRVFDFINTGLQPGESGDRDNSRFNGFLTAEGKPLKRMMRVPFPVHRAEAAVLMKPVKHAG
jgi:hypothetical protein